MAGDSLRKESAEPETPSTSVIRVSEDLSAQNVMSENSSPSLDVQCLDANGDSSVQITLSLDTVVDRIVETTVNSLDTLPSSLSAVSAPSQPSASDIFGGPAALASTRSPSLDPWLPGHLSGKWSALPLGTTNQGDSSHSPSDMSHDGPAIPSTAQYTTMTPLLPSFSPAAGVSTINEELSPNGGATEMDVETTEAGLSEPRSSKKAVRGRKAKRGRGARAASVSRSAKKQLRPVSIQDKDGELRSPLHKDTTFWVEQARMSFEEALNAATLAHEQVLLVKTEIRQDNGSGGDAESSTLAAVSAAASVAQAAAEAAKVAYEAAIQARDLYTAGRDGSAGGKFAGGSQSEGETGKDGGRRSAISAAREKARKKAKSVAVRKYLPEGTDVVLQAAQLMAEAASQAGVVLAKGNASLATTSSPLTVPQSDDKKKRRTGGRWKSHERVPAIKSEVAKESEGEAPEKLKPAKVKGTPKKGKSVVIVDADSDALEVEDIETGSPAQKPSILQVDEPKPSSSQAALASQSIVEGSLVEVMNDEEGLRGGWFSGKVIELKGGKAFVEYHELLAEDGSSDHLKEWIPLQDPHGRRPNIRLMSPSGSPEGEGKQNLLRSSGSTHKWKKGDKVDAFVSDGWWEGQIKALDGPDDAQKVTVYFPGEGDTSVVDAIHVRPSLLWENGNWIEVVYTEEDLVHPSKRQKLAVKSKGKVRKSGRKATHDSMVEEGAVDV